MNMEQVLRSLSFEDAIIMTAPPGWGKTYKLLRAIKKSKRKVVFVFPLRALCDEVYISSTKLNLNVCNLKSKIEIDHLKEGHFDAIMATPECLNSTIIDYLAREYLFIFDEAHLFFYWGESFRAKMHEAMIHILSYAPASIFLSATLNSDLMLKLKDLLHFNYKNIYHIDHGNLKLKNNPKSVMFYLKGQRKWLIDDIRFSQTSGVKLVFCPFRKQVKSITRDLERANLKVLSCVGGEASEFTLKLNETPDIDVIVATSVVSHGVNLPRISKIYFLNKIKNLDFYLQMLGRGGRGGEEFEVHTMNLNYFNKQKLFMGFLHVLLKRIRNKGISFLYYMNESRGNCHSKDTV